MKKLKIAVIGVGGISEQHIQGYLHNENTEVYALCDINAELLAKKGEKYGVTRLYTDEATMLKELPEIDAVSVCTWNCAHAPCSIMALNAGKDVLCEKPMAMNAKEAEEMIAAAKRNGKKLMVGFVRRFGNDAAIVKDFVDNGSLGEIYYAKASYLRRNGNPGGWFGDKKRSGGGPLIDLGVHVIDLTRYLMGNPKPVSVYGATFTVLGNRKGIKDKVASHTSAGKTDDDICDVEDMATAFVRYDNGAVLSVEASFSLNIKSEVGTIELFGTNGGVKLDPEFELYTQINGYLADVNLNMPTSLSFNGLFQNEIDYFVNAVLTDKDVSDIAEDGLTLMKILDAIYESAETCKEVVL
ncbi:MAG: Gfo/Idh/MocA family oxidoreductase [Clostridia bacterium]|nr:Gfo/Idh/MocA family oxidoreductase [Clostridia bacterium]